MVVSGAAEDAVRRPRLPGRVVADRFGGDSVGEPVEQCGSAEVDANLELAHVDSLALAGEPTAFEGGEYGDRAVQAGHVVVVAEADPMSLRPGTPVR